MLQARLAALAALALLPSCAAAVPEPVCELDGVLAIVATDVAAREIGAKVVPGPVGQIPSLVPGSVRCAAPVEVTYFDTNRYGSVPQVRLTTVEYTVRTGRNGLFVDAVSTIP